MKSKTTLVIIVVAVLALVAEYFVLSGQASALRDDLNEANSSIASLQRKYDGAKSELDELSKQLSYATKRVEEYKNQDQFIQQNYRAFVKALTREERTELLRRQFLPLITDITGAQENLADSQKFVADLGMQADQVEELMDTVGDEFYVEIPADDRSDLTTVGSVIQYIDSKLLPTRKSP